MNQDTLLEVNSLKPTSLLELMILDARNIGLTNPEPGYGGLYRFHGGTNGVYSPIIFDGYEYKLFPFQTSDWVYDGKGPLPRPRIKLTNVKGFISNLVVNNNNLVGAKIIRKRVY